MNGRSSSASTSKTSWSETPGERQRKWDLRFLDKCSFISHWSKDPSTQTGAVIVDSKHRSVSEGFNGFPRGMPDYPELYEDREEKYERIIHADMNAILFSARRDLDDCTMYTVPFHPCERCFPHIVQTGIRRMVAPPLPEHLLERWGKGQEKIQKWAKEIGIELVTLRPRVILPPVAMLTYSTRYYCSSCGQPLYTAGTALAPLWCLDAACPEYQYAQEGNHEQHREPTAPREEGPGDRAER